MNFYGEQFEVRKLNSHEQYACSVKVAKDLFRGTEAFVHFGSKRNFEFERYSKNSEKPKITGIVVASCVIRKLGNYPYASGNLTEGMSKYSGGVSFYVISDLEYGRESKSIFTETYLPLLHEWYLEITSEPETASGGTKLLLIEWVGGDFKTHFHRYRGQ